MSALIQKVIGIVGHNRVYPIIRDESEDKATPFVVVSLESSSTQRHYGIGQGYQSAITDYDFEIQCFGVVQSEALEEGSKVRAALDNFTGPLLDGASPQNVYNVHSIEVTSELVEHDFNYDLFYYSVFVTVIT